MFKKLFTPIIINGCEIPNRLAVSPMVTNYCNEDGTVTERYIAYHEAKAKGGWGLIITEDYAVNKNAVGHKWIPGLYHDGQIEGNQKLTDTVHNYGSKIFCQIYHPGKQSTTWAGGMQPVAPSAIPCPWMKELPRALTIPEIEQIVKDFGDCALRAKKSGFDGVELHGGNGYLIAQFLSHYINKRTDKYGGPLHNRVRFLKEIYEDVRSKVGCDFPVIIRISADEEMPGSRTIAETRVLARMFEEWGLDAIDVSCGVYSSYNNGTVSPMYVPYAWQADLAQEVKNLVNIPVFTVDRIKDPLMAEILLESGKADIIAMGRQTLADPDTPNKAKAGDLDSIRYCVGCLQGCTGSLALPGPITCLVNPSVGCEYKINDDKAQTPRNILIAGGGPGGLEAARGAAMKGHKVTLYEKRDFLGGQFVSAAYPPSKGELADYTTWIIQEIDRLGVKIILNTELTKEIVEAEKPDKIIVATGGNPLLPPIKGLDKPNVKQAEDVLLGNVATGNLIVVIGGGEVGCETAAHLAIQERGVTVVEMLPQLMKDLFWPNKVALMDILTKFGVTLCASTKVVEILDNGVTVEDPSGNQRTIPAETVVLAVGYAPNNKLAEELKANDSNVHVIGGAVKTSNALQAINEGFHLGVGIR